MLTDVPPIYMFKHTRKQQQQQQQQQQHRYCKVRPNTALSSTSSIYEAHDR